MSREIQTISAVESPATKQSLVGDLQELGLRSGDCVLVHSSMSTIGWTVGGPQAVCEALLEVVGPTGTVVMPSQCGDLSDPANWTNPPVPKEWHETIRSQMPAFRPDRTPTRTMGKIVECFRGFEDTLRSNHPHVSFIANGPAAADILSEHPLDDPLGDGSPLGRLYDIDAKVLFLGTGYANNTAMHLAENRASWPAKATTQESAPILVDGERVWTTWTQLDTDEDDFPKAGEAFAATGAESIGPVGAARATLFSLVEVVDFMVDWIGSNR